MPCIFIVVKKPAPPVMSVLTSSLDTGTVGHTSVNCSATSWQRRRASTPPLPTPSARSKNSASNLRIVLTISLSPLASSSSAVAVSEASRKAKFPLVPDHGGNACKASPMHNKGRPSSATAVVSATLGVMKMGNTRKPLNLSATLLWSSGQASWPISARNSSRTLASGAGSVMRPWVPSGRSRALATALGSDFTFAPSIVLRMMHTHRLSSGSAPKRCKVSMVVPAPSAVGPSTTIVPSPSRRTTSGDRSRSGESKTPWIQVTPVYRGFEASEKRYCRNGECVPVASTTTSNSPRTWSPSPNNSTAPLSVLRTPEIFTSNRQCSSPMPASRPSMTAVRFVSRSASPCMPSARNSGGSCGHRKGRGPSPTRNMRKVSLPFRWTVDMSKPARVRAAWACLSMSQPEPWSRRRP
mmetsp:Transcript_21804/g.64951  ORF Transcript_21804/g.64951 Transcript_21804/m.64951 type:complete len:411 (-) Transcript_21804:179-1411(-)